MSQIVIDNVPPDLEDALRREAARRQESVPDLARRILGEHMLCGFLLGSVTPKDPSQVEAEVRAFQHRWSHIRFSTDDLSRERAQEAQLEEDSFQRRRSVR